jgi:uncharacterized protein (UPF0147 family)
MTTTESKPLNGRQTQLIEALLCSATVRDAAEKVGMSARYAHKLLKERPEVRDAFRAAKAAALEQASALASARAAGSVEILWEIASNKAAPASARVSAAGRVLDLVVKLHEMENLASRLEELEGVLVAVKLKGNQ